MYVPMLRLVGDLPRTREKNCLIQVLAGTSWCQVSRYLLKGPMYLACLVIASLAIGKGHAPGNRSNGRGVNDLFFYTCCLTWSRLSTTRGVNATVPASRGLASVIIVWLHMWQYGGKDEGREYMHVGHAA